MVLELESKFSWSANMGSQCVITVPEGFEAENARIKVAAGYIRIEDVVFGNSEFQCDTGKIEFSGSIQKDFSVECGVGKVQMYLNQSEDLFCFDVECGLGKVKIGDTEYKGNTEIQKGSADADIKAEIDCGVGKIDIRFN